MLHLHYYPGNASLTPHMLLEELGVPYTNVWMTADEVKAPAFRDVSPLGLIPALALADGRTMIESAAMVSFLTTAHADKGLGPTPGSADHGIYLSWLHFMSTNLYMAYNMGDSDNFYSRNPAEEAFLLGKSIEKSNQLWAILAKRLEAEGPWLMGENFSALDLYAFMLCCWSRPKEVDLHAEFPAVAKLAKAVRARPKLKAALEAHGVMAPRS